MSCLPAFAAVSTASGHRLARRGPNPGAERNRVLRDDRALHHQRLCRVGARDVLCGDRDRAGADSALLSVAPCRTACPDRQIGRAHSELQSLMRISYAVFCLKKKKQITKINTITDCHTI